MYIHIHIHAVILFGHTIHTIMYTPVCMCVWLQNMLRTMLRPAWSICILLLNCDHMLEAGHLTLEAEGTTWYRLGRAAGPPKCAQVDWCFGASFEDFQRKWPDD